MSRAFSHAKATFAFLIIAGGLSIIIGTLMGGGYGRSGPAVNDDPRSILVRVLLVESDVPGTMPAELPPAGQRIGDDALETLQRAAREPLVPDSFRIRAPTVLVQHAESATISVDVAGRQFGVIISPRVIKVRDGHVLRVAIEMERSDAASSGAPRTAVFQTAYTTDSGGSVVLDLAGLGVPGSQAVMALYTELIDPSPRQGG
ncbi:MAG: hypothetical protein AAGA55_11785 [Planctomycetota bacterium]